MKYLKCGDDEVRPISYVIMQTLFSFQKGYELDTSFGGYAILGFEKVSSPFNSYHLMFTSFDFEQCARMLAEYRHQLEHDPDPEPDVPNELSFREEIDCIGLYGTEINTAAKLSGGLHQRTAWQ